MCLEFETMYRVYRLDELPLSVLLFRYISSDVLTEAPCMENGSSAVGLFELKAPF